MNTKHTPGPWHISSASKNAINAERNNKPIGIGTTYYDPDSVYFIGQDEAIANAILIATSPRLLSALKAMVENLIPLDSQDQAVVAEANAAIAQALGQ